MPLASAVVSLVYDPNISMKSCEMLFQRKTITFRYTKHQEKIFKVFIILLMTRHTLNLHKSYFALNSIFYPLVLPRFHHLNSFENLKLNNIKVSRASKQPLSQNYGSYLNMINDNNKTIEDYLNNSKI